MDELEKRVQQFNSLSLPGQPMGMHMGTSYLVNDLWREIQRLRAEQSVHPTVATVAAQEVKSDDRNSG